MAIQEIHVPDTGGSKAIDVIDILVKVGDTVEIDTPLLTLESDKATMEVPSPFAGKITEIKVVKGDKVSESDLIFLMETNQASDISSVKEKAPVAETTQIVTVPDMGGAKSVDVIEILVKVGDVVNVDDPLIGLESDKATMEVPSPFAGVVEKIDVKLGDKLTEGAAILQMKVKGAVSPSLSQTTSSAAAPAKSAPAASSATVSKTSNDFASYDADIAQKNKASSIYAGPSVRRAAQEFGVDLGKVKGTGRKDRILPEDVHLYVKRILREGGGSGSGAGLNLLPWPQVDFKKFGEIELQPLNKIKKITAANLHRNWVMMPHVTQFDEADITQMEEYRQANKAEAEKNGYKLTPIIFIIKAVISALKMYPQFNASLDETGDNLILKKYFNIGVAVDTPNGLVVPVLRNADTKTIAELAIELATISKKAREKGLSPQEMQGGNFAISSLGGIGGTAFTPIINAPDVAILGISKSQTKPVYIEGKLEPRLMLPLCLSYDHRVIDGADGARFIGHIREALADMAKLRLV